MEFAYRRFGKEDGVGNSFMLSQHIRNTHLIIYPGSGHASQFQYPDLFLSHARMFLEE